ncbi:YbcC family protein [Blastopirellula retiformator]|uniref:Probable inorganic carbon transporter subunit DabA n=1 Tax=Blastopirellula retiformator TaxID=2527970 RepID=A0A5C5UWA8_9BACT|nr:DUF2309 domain-containing protein [Blastopirellula retiformator]TWT30664.1 hypothetical protein Enr8_41850 [Blastopirellula retiformator]
MEMTLNASLGGTRSSESISQQVANSRAPHLSSLLADVEKMTPPLWSLADYVAVNPFLGLSEEKFLTARRMMAEVRDCELLPSMDTFRKQFRENGFERTDLEQALKQAAHEYPEWYQQIDLAEIEVILNGNASPTEAPERTAWTIAELIDQSEGSDWNSHIINDISRNVASYFDQGQASWTNPWKSESLFTAWRNSATISRRMEMLGVADFRQFVKGLPAKPSEAILQLLTRLGAAPARWRCVLLSEIFSVAGWASFIKNQGGSRRHESHGEGDLIGLLAIRLAYDAALVERQLPAAASASYHSERWKHLLERSDLSPNAPSAPVLARYVCQTAVEIAFRRRLCGQLSDGEKSQSVATRKAAQFVFCIDVRSEVMRRNLEKAAENVESFGFAGFFGIPMQYVSLGGGKGSAQCPVLLQPTFSVHEIESGASEAEQAADGRRRLAAKNQRAIWKSFQSSAASCFSFVETVGAFFVAKLLKDSLNSLRFFASSKFATDGRLTRTQSGDGTSIEFDSEFSIEKRCSIAENVLRNLGLTDNFARIVAFCGHGAEVTNNPYHAGLDCGACGGHSGAPNARVATRLLNDDVVRQYLRLRGIVIPEDTWFVPALHKTTTDEIQILDVDLLPDTHREELTQLQESMRTASQLCREERSGRMDASSPQDLIRRSQDWAETRPEWGLAGNAAFVIAPRWRTAGIDLGGRIFMHSYDPERDVEGKVLELILTAPTVVASWINLQYYASTVDNQAFGSGNKLLHNVVGKFGVFEGNGGDLKTGLPWQSVHDGSKLQHQPQRLLVLVDAPRERVETILQNHTGVRDLVSNGWVSLVVMENDGYYRWTESHAWQICPPTEC